ncbi:hypothetical protein Celal_4012 [Cellulophaga algicola DSM 14237]|uniref:DUF3592 domain-containing protein n=1 Tax=Cellulophaga algicola (strain DSM 14237 / IC166 / ACAM 630) TaxID=688270 RepID=E6XDR8_CELAD|nr:DUF3592 domain-containing protein [Cellulophaga algicola]ADV51256.1 hypothetical protein Celal_4012 [Cellulophaga algicola DSM 14237]
MPMTIPLKFIITTLLFISFTLPVAAQEIDPSWVEIEATITEIHKSIGRRGRTNAFADVTFTTKKEEAIQTRVEILAIPIYGSVKSAGDIITIYYNPETPQIAASQNVSFFNTYGLYILIAIGVVISAMRIIKLKKSYTEK